MLDLQLIEDSIPYVDDIPKLKETIMALIRHIRNTNIFTDAELKEIKEAVWESLNQFQTKGYIAPFSHHLGVLRLKVEDLNHVFTEHELKTRQAIIRKVRDQT